MFIKKIKATMHLRLLHREMIWSYTANEIKKDLLLGKGLSSSRKIGEEHQITFVEKIFDTQSYLNSHLEKKNFSAIPLHPHNNTLQIWLELGLIGCLLFLLLYLLLWKKLAEKISKYSTKNIFLILPFIGVLYINQISFGLWQTWWLVFRI